MTVNFSNLTVLTIDDNANMRQLIRSVLRGFGVRKIMEASDGTEALQRIHPNPSAVDVIICDWNMAGLDGHGFLKELRGDPEAPWAGIPVIMLTAHNESSVVKKARDAGADGFLLKPVTPRLLLERIHQVVERPKDFVVSAAYAGPERRTRHNGPNNSERRHPAPRHEKIQQGRKVIYIGE